MLCSVYPQRVSVFTNDNATIIWVEYSYSKITVNSIALWNGVGDFNWHWDGPGNDDIYALVYLSDYKFVFVSVFVSALVSCALYIQSGNDKNSLSLQKTTQKTLDRATLTLWC
jgi:hypothetical protein